MKRLFVSVIAVLVLSSCEATVSIETPESGKDRREEAEKSKRDFLNN